MKLSKTNYIFISIYVTLYNDANKYELTRAKNLYLYAASRAMASTTRRRHTTDAARNGGFS